MLTLPILIQQLQQQGIHVTLTRKRVKNINFRIYPHQLNVSVPVACSDAQIIRSLQNRLDWIINTHAKLLINQSQQANHKQPQPFMLWGVPQQITVSERVRLAYYRNQLAHVMPQLFAKWQPIVGATANETRIKKMNTLWGSCNIKAKRIWLSVYLPAYPIECTEYVIVHELCHLHHANHSKAFWQTVANAMPNYKKWHDKLQSPQKSID